MLLYGWVGKNSEKNGAFYLSLVKPSMLQQARAEVMLHMAHSLFSTFHISFEILEKSKVIFNKLKFEGFQWSLANSSIAVWVSSSAVQTYS